jgi:adenylate kinase family enzyme
VKLLGSAAVRRVSLIGISGSGKSTLARELARILGLPHTELDSIIHQAGWTALPVEEFRRRVSVLVAQERWVLDGNYSGQVQSIIWARADTVVWLDLPRPVVMRRVITRTLHRVLGRVELWNGNRESWRQLLSWDKEENVVAWAWQMQSVQRARYTAAMADPANGHLRFIRLRSPGEVRRFLRSASGGSASGGSASGGSASGGSASGGDQL